MHATAADECGIRRTRLLLFTFHLSLLTFHVPGQHEVFCYYHVRDPNAERRMPNAERQTRVG